MTTLLKFFDIITLIYRREGQGVYVLTREITAPAKASSVN
jgi:hypothetical protein